MDATDKLQDLLAKLDTALWCYAVKDIKGANGKRRISVDFKGAMEELQEAYDAWCARDELPPAPFAGDVACESCGKKQLTLDVRRTLAAGAICDHCLTAPREKPQSEQPS